MGDYRSKRCGKCKKTKSLSAFSKNSAGAFGVYSVCNPCKAVYDAQPKVLARKRTHFHKNKRWFKDYWLKKNWGISVETYESMKTAQNSVCAICREPGKKMGLVVDHDHASGKIRGLLCSRCNLFLGRLEARYDLVEASLEYLAKHSRQKP